MITESNFEACICKCITFPARGLTRGMETTPQTNTATQILNSLKTNAMPRHIQRSLKALLNLTRGENKQLFHPTITTGIAPMAVLIYMNAAIFAGELKGLHVGRRFNLHNKNSTPTIAQPRPSITCVLPRIHHPHK